MKKASILLCFSLLFPMSNLSAKETGTLPSGEGKIEVNGSSSVSITPDVLYVEIGMREYYKYLDTGDSVIVTIKEIENSVEQSLKKAGIPDSLVTISNYGNYYYALVSKGFLMSKSITAKLTSVEQLETLASGMNIKGITSFRISKTDASDMESYNRQGLKAALDKARDKAEFIAKNSGMEIIMPIDIVEDGPVYYDEATVTNVTLNGVAEESSADTGTLRMTAKGAAMDSMKKIVRRYNVRVTYSTRKSK